MANRFVIKTAFAKGFYIVTFATNFGAAKVVITFVTFSFKDNLVTGQTAMTDNVHVIISHSDKAFVTTAHARVRRNTSAGTK
jgi:hypothetical protein